MSVPLLAIARLDAQLSLLAIGGVNAVIPEMQRQVVDVHHWMGAAEFASMFALGQASPGPNMLVAVLIGWRLAGLAGAAVATVSMIGPTCVVAYGVFWVWGSARLAGVRAVMQAGLTPVTVGLVLGAALLLARASWTGPVAGAITLATATVVLATRLNPMWLLAAGAALGAAGVV